MAATHEKFCLFLFVKSKVNQSTRNSAHTISEGLQNGYVSERKDTTVWIFFLLQPSQPFNQQYGGHTWEIFPLSFSKIQSQPVNHQKRIHLLRPSDSSNFKLGLPRQNSKSTSQPGKAHTPYSKTMDKPVNGKTPLLEIFSHYNQVNYSPNEMAQTQFDFLVRNHKSTIQPAIWRPHMRNFAFVFL